MRIRGASGQVVGPSERRALARAVRLEAGAWGILKALNDAFINPLLISREAGAIALGIYNSGANLFGFGAGWLGPRLAAQRGSVRRTAIACLLVGRTALLLLALYLLMSDKGGVAVIIPLIFLWGIGEGLVVPLWQSFLAGMVGPSERGRWLAMRGSFATLSTVPIMISLVVLFLVSTRERVLPIAYLAAAVAGLVSLVMVRRIFTIAGEAPVPAARSVRSLPDEPGARRFLGGVWLFWFGAGLVWPVLPPYILNELGAPTLYFAISSLSAAVIGVFMQRKWGKWGDERGTAFVLLFGGIGAALVPALWGVVPVFWLGFAIEIIGFICWPGHMLGLTLRSVELAKHEQDRSSLLGWTNLAQGSGAFLSPLLASLAVGTVGTVPILFASAALRLAGTLVIAHPRRGASSRAGSA